MWQLCEELAKVAPIFTPVVATAALLVAWRQLRLNRLNQRETTAKATWREYLKLAFEHPKLASGKVSTMSEAEYAHYEWFVGHLLWGVEEILFFSKRDPIWEENIRQQLLFHRHYFRSNSEFREKELKSYSPAVQTLVERAIMTV